MRGKLLTVLIVVIYLFTALSTTPAGKDTIEENACEPFVCDKCDSLLNELASGCDVPGERLSALAQAEDEDYLPIIVMLRPERKSSKRQDMQEETIGDLTRTKNERGFEVINGFSADVKNKKKYIKSNLERLRDNGDVVGVYADRVVSLPEPDTLTAKLETSTQSLGANYIWSTGYSGSGVVVAIIDSGIDYTHPDLGNCTNITSCTKVSGGYDFVNQDDDPMDDQGHGTHCAGIVAANGTKLGVAPNATLLAVKVLNSTGDGTSSQIMHGMDWAFNNNADVMSMSLGGARVPNDGRDVWAIVADSLVDMGAVIVVAAGNDGPGTGGVSSPGCSHRVITVGAVNDKGTIPVSDDDIIDFSNRGPSAFGRLDPDLSAPGVYINSSVPTGACELCDASGYDSLSGTSMATPHVSGAIALMLEKDASLAPAEIRARLMNSAYNLSANHTFEKGAGLLNITAVMSYDSYLWAENDDRWEVTIFPGNNHTGTLKLQNANATASRQFSSFTIIDDLTDIEGDNSISKSYFTLPATTTVPASSEEEVPISLYVPVGSSPSTYGTTLKATTDLGYELRLPIAVTVPLFDDGVIYGTTDDKELGTDVGDMIAYKIVSHNADSVTLNLSWDDAGDDLDLFLFAPSGESLDSSESGVGVSEFISWPDANLSEYWVAVYTYDLNGVVCNYNLTVTYGSDLSVAPANKFINVSKGTQLNLTFTLTNDASADANLNLTVRSLVQGHYNFTEDSVAAGNYDLILFGSNGWPYEDARYLNTQLQWGNSSTDIDLFFVWKNSSTIFYSNSRVSSKHNNTLLGTGVEKIENLDIQSYAKNWADMGLLVQNAKGAVEQSYNLTINLTDVGEVDYCQASPSTIANLGASASQNVSVLINTTGLGANDTYELYFMVDNSTKTFATVPLTLSIMGAVGGGSASNTAPVVTPVLPLDGANETNDTTPDFTFYASDQENNTLSCTLYINSTAYGANASVANATNTTITANASLTNGTYEWHINCTDGEYTNVSETRILTINTTGEVLVYEINISANTTSSTVDNTSTAYYLLTLWNNGDAQDTINLTTNNLNNASMASLNQSTLALGANTSGTVLLSVSDETPGEYNVTVNATSNGNSSESDSTGVITTTVTALDSTAPTVNLVSPANQIWDNDGTVSFVFNATDDMSQILNCSLYVGGSLNSTNESVANGTDTTFDVSGLSDSSSTSWFVRCKDNTSNTGTSSTRTIKVDTTAPSITMVPTNNSVHVTASVSINGSLSDGLSGINTSTFVLTVDGSVVSANLSSNKFNYTTSDLAVGKHNLSAWVYDVAGNFRNLTRTFIINYTEVETNDTYETNGSTVTYENGTDIANATGDLVLTNGTISVPINESTINSTLLQATGNVLVINKANGNITLTNLGTTLRIVMPVFSQGEWSGELRVTTSTTPIATAPTHTNYSLLTINMPVQEVETNFTEYDDTLENVSSNVSVDFNTSANLSGKTFSHQMLFKLNETLMEAVTNGSGRSSNRFAFFMRFSTTFLDDEIQGATLNFRIPKGWMDAKGYDPTSVVVEHLYENGTYAGTLTATYQGLSGRHYYYTVTLTGFSYYGAVATEDEEEDDDGVDEAEEDNSGSGGGGGGISLVGLGKGQDIPEPEEQGEVVGRQEQDYDYGTGFSAHRGSLVKVFSDGTYRTDVLLKLVNGGEDICRVKITEEIPKTVAEHVDDLDFEPEPVIIEEDPVVQWEIPHMEPGETKTFKYSVAKAVNITGMSQPTIESTIIKEAIEITDEPETTPEYTPSASEEEDEKPIAVYLAALAVLLALLAIFLRIYMTKFKQKPVEITRISKDFEPEPKQE